MALSSGYLLSLFGVWVSIDFSFSLSLMDKLTSQHFTWRLKRVYGFYKVQFSIITLSHTFIGYWLVLALAVGLLTDF